MAKQKPSPTMRRKNHHVFLLALSIVFLMGALAYASVPLYRLFCQVTGYGGTTRVAEAAPQIIKDRQITVRFNADTNRALPWAFSPQESTLTLDVGETGMTSYHARNQSSFPVVGTATYNVTPHKAGRYFHKIQCFCFEEQLLAAGQDIDMPVLFFIDPAIVNDKNLDDVDTITLSYTFFPAKSQELAEALTNYAQQLH